MSEQGRRSPHIRGYTGACIDYNGVGRWSIGAIRERYLAHAAFLGCKPVHLVPRRHAEGERTWVYPLMERITELIRVADPAAIEIGIEFVEEDDFFAFGKVLKSNTARELRRTVLSEVQRERLRTRLVTMLISGNVPHEFHEYKKLLRSIGLGSHWPALDAGIDRNDRYVMRHYEYLARYAPQKQES